MPSCEACPEEILGRGARLLGSGLMKQASFPAAHSALSGLKPFRIMELWNAGNILLLGISVLQLLKTMYTSATWGRFSHKVASEPREAQRLSPGYPGDASACALSGWSAFGADRARITILGLTEKGEVMGLGNPQISHLAI